jgi:chromosomal replication initiation ATPase DnaA
MVTPPQLSLAFVHVRHSRLGPFLRAPSNEAAVAWLERTADWPQRRLALWGEEGCGKTHLLTDWAARAGAQMLHGSALPGLHELPELPAGGLAIDDAADLRAEDRLLHLLNAAAEARVPVLLAARDSPARWRVGLPDLASRLRAITSVRIGSPDPDLLQALLARLFEERGHRVAEATRRWLLSLLPRSPASLRLAVDRLDRASVACPGGITVPLARRVLADLLQPPDPRAGEEGDAADSVLSSSPGSPPGGTLL